MHKSQNIDYRQAFLDQYYKFRGHLSGDILRKWELFFPYFQDNYAKLLPQKRSAKILDIGFGEGIFLNWASKTGYTNLYGVDPCPAFVEMVRDIPNVKSEVGMAIDYLEKHPGEFDAITIKAVLEHIPKTEIFTVVKLMHDALKPGGVLIVDVPNMDWLFAQHERYMDFTHEVGFTAESLRDVLSYFFPKVSIHYPKDRIEGNLIIKTIVKLGRPITRYLFKAFLYLLSSDGMSSLPWQYRSIIALGEKE